MLVSTHKQHRSFSCQSNLFLSFPPHKKLLKHNSVELHNKGREHTSHRGISSPFLHSFKSLNLGSDRCKSDLKGPLPLQRQSTLVTVVAFFSPPQIYCQCILDLHRKPHTKSFLSKKVIHFLVHVFLKLQRYIIKSLLRESACEMTLLVFLFFVESFRRPPWPTSGFCLYRTAAQSSTVPICFPGSVAVETRDKKG